MTERPAPRRLAALVVVGSLAIGALASGCSSNGGSSSAEAKLSAAGERGKVVAKEQGCTSCHSADGSKGVGPTWKGLAGSKVELEDGTTVTADDAYLRDAILEARTQVVDGYANIMPVYADVLSDAEVAKLLAYLHDLAPSDTGSGEGSGGS